MFPGVSSFTSADSVTVRGKASDQTGIKTLTVNDLAVTTSNQWADWQIKIAALKNGMNTLVVKAEDTLGQITETTLKIEKQIPMFAPALTALDVERNRFFIYDASLKAIFGVDMTTGERSILTQYKEGDEIAITEPTAMIYDATKDRLLLSQYQTTRVEGFSASYLGNIIAINPTSGLRSVFVSGAILIDISTPSLSLRKPISLTIDPDTRTLYVLDEKAGFIRNDGGQLVFDVAVLKYSLDDAAPTFTRVSDNQINKEEPLVGSLNLRFDTQSKKLIVDSQFGSEYDSNNNPVASWFGIYSIDPATGTRTAISGKNVHTDTNYGFKILTQGDFFVDGGYAYYNDLSANPRRVLKVNLATGERTEWFNNLAQDNKYNLRAPIKLERDPKNNLVYALDGALKSVLKIEPLNNFKRTPIATNGTLNENTALNYLSSGSLVWDKARDRILINNQIEGTINAYDLTTGNTTVFCNFGINNQSQERVFPLSTGIDELKQRTISTVNYYSLVGDTLTIKYRLDSCDLKDGKHSVVSDENDTTNIALSNPNELTIDSNNQKAYTFNLIRIVDNAIYDQSTLVEIDLSNGARSEVAALQFGKAPVRENPSGGLAFDKNTGNIYFSQLFNASIYSVSPTTKTINLISDNKKDTSSLLSIPKKLFMQGNELIALDSAHQKLIAVNPDGKRTTRYTLNTTGSNPINQVGGMILDSENNRLFVTDLSVGVLTLQDLVTNETIYLAK